MRLTGWCNLLSCGIIATLVAALFALSIAKTIAGSIPLALAAMTIAPSPAPSPAASPLAITLSLFAASFIWPRLCRLRFAFCAAGRRLASDLNLCCGGCIVGCFGLTLDKCGRGRMHHRCRRRIAWRQRLQALDAKFGRHQRVVVDEVNSKTLSCFQLRQRLALVVQNEQGDGGWHCDRDGGALLASAFFVDRAQHMQCRRFRRANMAGAAAEAADLGAGLEQAGAQALTRQFK